MDRQKALPSTAVPAQRHFPRNGDNAAKAARRTLLATLLVSNGLVLPGLALASAPAPAPGYPPSIGKLVAETKKQIKAIKLDEFRAAYDRKELGTLIDVCEEDVFVDGYVPGAADIARGLIEFRIWKKLGFLAEADLNKHLTLYCATGGRCSLATKAMQHLGFTNVASVDMKFEHWVKAGHPVEKPAKKWTTARLQGPEKTGGAPRGRPAIPL